MQQLCKTSLPTLRATQTGIFSKMLLIRFRKREEKKRQKDNRNKDKWKRILKMDDNKKDFWKLLLVVVMRNKAIYP